MNREETIRQLFTEAEDRILKGEDPDPCTAVVGALLRKEAVGDFELEVVLAAHTGGPWHVNTTEKLEVFSKWCSVCGSPLRFSEAVAVVNGQTVYREDYGDCCLSEAARGNRWAVWTRKGRLHIGFANEADAIWFRDVGSRLFSLEATDNKRVALVVVEGGDNPEMINRATELLLTRVGVLSHNNY